MSNELRAAFRMALAVALTLSFYFLLQIPNSLRALLAASLLCTSSSFQKNLMRQRFILMWRSSAMGMTVDICFRDAFWFYIPAFMLLIYTTMHLASRSRDTVTMVLLVYGYTGSIPNSDFFAADPVIKGFQYSVGTSLGAVMVIIAFLFFPIRKDEVLHLPAPVYFGRRALFFLSVTSGVIICVSAAVIPKYDVFVMMLGLVWAISLLSQKFSALRLQIIGLVIGCFVSLGVISMFSSSSDNVVFYVALLATIAGLAAYLGGSYPAIKPGQGFFIVGALMPCIFLFKPIPNLTILFPLFFAMGLGIFISSLVFLVFRLLEETEKWVMTWGISSNGQDACSCSVFPRNNL